MFRNKLISFILLGFWLFDKDGNPIEEIKSEMIDEEKTEKVDFLTEKYFISDLFSGSS